MTYLIDNQLPTGLVRHLQSQGLQASHVADCGLDRASDREIWDYAAANGCVVVSKDEDFFHLSGADPNGPPFVWVRLGNCRNAALFAAFDSILPQLLQANRSTNAARLISFKHAASIASTSRRELGRSGATSAA